MEWIDCGRRFWTGFVMGSIITPLAVWAIVQTWREYLHEKRQG